MTSYIAVTQNQRIYKITQQADHYSVEAVVSSSSRAQDTIFVLVSLIRPDKKAEPIKVSFFSRSLSNCVGKCLYLRDPNGQVMTTSPIIEFYKRIE